MNHIKPTDKQIKDAVNSCMNSIWETGKKGFTLNASMDFARSGASNGSSTVSQTYRSDGRSKTYTVAADAFSKSGAELDKTGERGGYAMGYTGYPTSSNAISYIANDLYKDKNHSLKSGLDKVIDQSKATQIHELGVALATWFGQKDPPEKYWNKPKEQDPYPDRDSGMTLEDCVYKRLTQKK